MKVKKARLCIECDNVFHAKNDSCPHCGGTVWMPLTAFVPSLKGGDEDEQAARASYRPQAAPEPVPTDPPRRFFARAWARLMAPFHSDAEVAA